MKKYSALILFALLLPLMSSAGRADARSFGAVADWKLPLPPGDYVITQGDKDNCLNTHCLKSGLGQWVYCSIDIARDDIDDMPVLAPADGTILSVGYQPKGAGNFVTILHDDGLVSQYEHLRKVYVAKNDRVEQGKPFARVDDTGNSFGGHLHFGVFKDSSYKECLTITSIDGNTSFRIRDTIRSTNVQKGSLPDTPTQPIQPAPPIPPRPSAPVLLSPGQGDAFSESTDIAFRWNAVSGANQYLLEYQSASFGVLSSPWINQTNHIVSQLPSGTLSWRVRARDVIGQLSDWSEARVLVVQPQQAQLPTLAPPTRLPPPVSSPARLVVVGALDVSPTTAPANQPVNARFRVRNDGGQTIRARFLGVKGRDSSGRNYDFFWIENLDLSPGQEYLYDANRGFDRAETYSLTPSYSDGSNWYDVSRVDGSGTTVFLNVVTAIAPTSTTIPPPAPPTPTSTTIPPPAPPTPTFKPLPPAVPPTQAPSPTPAPPAFTGNIAPRAQRVPDGIASGNAFDGNLSTFWTNGLGHRFELRLILPATLTVSRILVWDRPQNSPDNQQINQLIVMLSNGLSKRFDMNSEGPRCIDVTLSPPQAINTVTLKADDASGNNGLSEVEIWAGNKTGGPSCSNKRTLP